jgi:hypothetical protein
MAKEKTTITIDPEVLADADAAAHAAGMNRSAYIERVLRHEHYRRLLESSPQPSSSDDEEHQLRRAVAWQQETARGQPPAA